MIIVTLGDVMMQRTLMIFFGVYSLLMFFMLPSSVQAEEEWGEVFHFQIATPEASREIEVLKEKVIKLLKTDNDDDIANNANKCGIAKANKPFSGHANANLHNHCSKKSQMISVTTDRNVALKFARNKGIILSKDVPAWSLFKSPDLYQEGELLLIGSQKGFKVEKIYSSASIEQKYNSQ